jgi:hypothetical protein
VDWIATTEKKSAVISTQTTDGNERVGFLAGWRRYRRSGKREAAGPTTTTPHAPATPKWRFNASPRRHGIETVCVSGGTSHHLEQPSDTADIDIAYGIQNSTLSPR